MFGERINEFDNSDGTIESFNRIFPRTTLGNSLGKYVEIKDTVSTENAFGENLFIKYLRFYDKDFNFILEAKHDFGRYNFIDSKEYVNDCMVKFKYIAKDLDNKVIAVAYGWKELAKKLGVGLNTVKARFQTPITKHNVDVKRRFNVKRIEL
jgi:hypothetical protein